MRRPLQCLLILLAGVIAGAGTSHAQRVRGLGPVAKQRPAARAGAIKHRSIKARQTHRRGPGARQRPGPLKVTTPLRSSAHRPSATKRSSSLPPVKVVRGSNGAKAAPRGQRVKVKRAAPRAKRVSPLAKVGAKGAKAVKHKLAALRNHPKVKSAILRVQKISAAITRKLDAWQARGPPWLSKGMGAVRTYSLMSLAGFSLKKVKADGKFLGSYMVANSIISNVVLPGSIALGMDPVLSGILNLASTPLTMGVIILRERHLKKKAGEDLSIAQTAKSVLRDYASYAKERRVQSSARAQRLATAP